MIVEPYSPYIENLLQAEPWRASQGTKQELCDGTIDFDGSPYWCCQKCGKVGTSSFQIHHPVRSPGRFILDVLGR